MRGSIDIVATWRHFLESFFAVELHCWDKEILLLEQPGQLMEKSLQSKATVLVVEDNADAREIFALTLSTNGYQVIEAENGAEGLERLKEFVDVDVILTDLRMPIMDGFEMAAAIKASPALRHIPIVVLTATPLADKAAMLRQFAALLLKPCSMDELLRTIATALSSEP